MAHGPERVIVFDTTLRDGEQAPGFSLDVAAKVTLARALDALGVDIIEAGFPIASPADSEAVRQVAHEVRRPTVAALARCRRQDIEEAARALAPAERPRIHTFLATSDLHLRAKLRMTREACLEAIVMALRVRQDRLPFDTAVRSAALYETSQLLSTLTQEAVQANKAIVGRNAFAHEAGIHQDGVLKDPRTYEIMRPQDVGQPSARLVLGRHSGRHAVQQRCEALGLRVSTAEIEHIYREVITLGE